MAVTALVPNAYSNGEIFNYGLALTLQYFIDKAFNFGVDDRGLVDVNLRFQKIPQKNFQTATSLI